MTEEINLNEAAFTTKHVVDANSPIVYVTHDTDGDWQFFGAEKIVSIEESRVISLGEIIEMDASIKELLLIPSLSKAQRINKDAKWEITIRE